MVDPRYDTPVYCQRCGVLIAYIAKNAQIRAHCADPGCLETQAGSQNEERDSVMELMYAIGRTPEAIGSSFGISRQAAARLLS